MAVQAALTGHLVLSTLHTNDAPTTITRLLDLGLPSFLIKSTLLGVMAQRLVRTLCPNCKEPGSITQAEWDELVKPWKAPMPDMICQPVGCLECRNTGYLGRQGIYEIMPLTEGLKELITSQCDFNALRKAAMKEGMRSLRLSGAQKIAAGLTTLEEILRVAPSTEA
jgi:general secretion pathway protein E